MRKILSLFVVATCLFVAQGSFAQVPTFKNTLVDAADHGNQSLTSQLLQSGMSPNGRGNFGVTALIRSAFRGHTDIVAILLAAGADANLADLGGATALHVAARQGHYDIVKLLLERHAEIDAVDEEGWTPLMRAAVNKKTDVVELLVEMGADTKIENEWGESALFHATQAGDDRAVVVLVDRNLETRYSSNTEPAKKIAKQRGFSEIAETLEAVENETYTPAAPVVPSQPVAPESSIEMERENNEVRLQPRPKAPVVASGDSKIAHDIAALDAQIKAMESELEETEKSNGRVEEVVEPAPVPEVVEQTEKEISNLPWRTEDEQVASVMKMFEEDKKEEEVVELPKKKRGFFSRLFRGKEKAKADIAKPAAEEPQEKKAGMLSHLFGSGVKEPESKPLTSSFAEDSPPAEYSSYQEPPVATSPTREEEPPAPVVDYSSYEDVPPPPAAIYPSLPLDDEPEVILPKAKAELEVAEAIRVPLSKAPPKVNIQVPAEQTDAFKSPRSLWVEIGGFASNKDATKYWHGMERHPAVQNLRMRTIQRGLRRFSTGTYLRIGAVASQAQAQQICKELVREKELSCNVVRELARFNPKQVSRNKYSYTPARHGESKHMQKPLASYYGMLGTFVSRSAAMKHFDVLKEVHGRTIGAFKAHTEPIGQSYRGPTMVRLYVGPIPGYQKANQVCGKLKERYLACLPVKK